MTKTAHRCMAFLVGIKEERPTRARIAKALKRSERTVKRAIAELVEIGWVTCEGGGNGTPAKIHALSFEEWVLARDSKTAPVVAPVNATMAPDRPGYKSLGINITSTRERVWPKPMGTATQNSPETERILKWAEQHGYRVETGAGLLRVIEAMEAA